MAKPQALGDSLNGLKSHRVLGRRKPHGTRLRYLSGCKCWRCTKANRNYERERQKARAAGDWNGIVPAEKARRHLELLRTVGIGRRTVAQATGIAQSILTGIRSGKRRNLRARSERRILAVRKDALPGRTRIVIGPTRRLLRELYATGYTVSDLCECLGYKSRYSLQLQPSWITLTKARRIESLYWALI